MHSLQAHTATTIQTRRVQEQEGKPKGACCCCCCLCSSPLVLAEASPLGAEVEHEGSKWLIKWTEFETHCCFSLGTAALIIVWIVLLVSQGGGMVQNYVYGCAYMIYNDSPAKSEQNERKVTSRMWLFVDENGHGSANQMLWGCTRSL